MLIVEISSRFQIIDCVSTMDLLELQLESEYLNLKRRKRYDRKNLSTRNKRFEGKFPKFGNLFVETVEQFSLFVE